MSELLTMLNIPEEQLNTLDNLIISWELTSTDIINGSDGIKFDDGLYSLKSNLIESVSSAIYNKVCNLTEETDYYVDEMYEFTVTVVHVDDAYEKQIFINSLQELKALLST